MSGTKVPGLWGDDGLNLHVPFLWSLVKGDIFKQRWMLIPSEIEEVLVPKYTDTYWLFNILAWCAHLKNLEDQVNNKTTSQCSAFVYESGVDMSRCWLTYSCAWKRLPFVSPPRKRRPYNEKWMSPQAMNAVLFLGEQVPGLAGVSKGYHWWATKCIPRSDENVPWHVFFPSKLWNWGRKVLEQVNPFKELIFWGSTLNFRGSFLGKTLI